VPSAAQHDAWSVTKGDGDRFTVDLRGEVNAQAADGLDRELRSQLAGIEGGSCEVLFDLNDLRRCDAQARSALARLQHHIGGVARRTAYVANRPAFRGLALWVCHTAPDDNARTFPSVDEATAWLTSSELRPDTLREGAIRWMHRLKKLPRRSSK